MSESKVTERCSAVMGILHIGHSARCFFHSPRQCLQKLWAQFIVTAATRSSLQMLHCSSSSTRDPMFFSFDRARSRSFSLSSFFLISSSAAASFSIDSSVQLAGVSPSSSAAASGSTSSFGSAVWFLEHDWFPEACSVTISTF